MLGPRLNVAIATLGLLATLGVGRYGYPVILPAMRTGLDLTYTEAGLLATASSLSWMALVPFIGVLAVQLGPRRVVTAAAAITVVAMLMLATATTFGVALAAQVLLGVGMGTGVALFMTIPAAQFDGRARFLATGVTATGQPLSGIVVGVGLPLVLAAGGAAGWRWGWLALAGPAIVVTVLCALALRVPVIKAPDGGWREVYRNRAVWHFTATAFGYPLGFIIFWTFFVVFLVTERGFSPAGAGQLWALSGFAGLFSGLLSGWLAARIGRTVTLGLGGVALCLSIGLPVVAQSMVALVALAILFGLCGSTNMTIGPALAAQYVGPRLAPAAVSLMMLFSGAGQAVGAAAGGQLRDLTGSFDAVFIAGAVVVGLSTISTFLLPEPALSSRGPQVSVAGEQASS